MADSRGGCLNHSPVQAETYQPFVLTMGPDKLDNQTRWFCEHFSLGNLHWKCRSRCMPSKKPLITRARRHFDTTEINRNARLFINLHIEREDDSRRG
jgi:hypothetical protein